MYDVDRPIDPKKSFARLEGDNVFRIYDINTHKLIAEKNPLVCSEEYMKMFLKPPGKRLVEYHPYIGDLIVDEILEGKTLLQISKDDRFPSMSVMQRWLMKYEDFFDKIRKAERSRAQIFHDKIVDVADQADTPMSDAELKTARLKVDTLKWAAKKGDAERYGDKTTIDGNLDHAVTIVVQTGIRRDPLSMEEKEVIDADFISKEGDRKSDSPSEHTRVEEQTCGDGDV